MSEVINDRFEEVMDKVSELLVLVYGEDFLETEDCLDLVVRDFEESIAELEVATSKTCLLEAITRLSLSVVQLVLMTKAFETLSNEEVSEFEKYMDTHIDIDRVNRALERADVLLAFTGDQRPVNEELADPVLDMLRKDMTKLPYLSEVEQLHGSVNNGAIQAACDWIESNKDIAVRHLPVVGKIVFDKNGDKRVVFKDSRGKVMEPYWYEGS